MAQFVATLRATSAVLSIIALAGCGESREGQASAAAPGPAESAPAPAAVAEDACALVTAAEFQQATGFPVRDKKSFSGASPGCEWQLETDAVHRISMDIRAPGGRERFDFMASGSLAKIPDLGDGAVQTGGNMDGTVWAVTDDTLVTLRYSLPVTTSDPNAVVLPLMRLILSRL